MKTKHRGLLAIAAVAALSLTACAGGTDETAAAAPAETPSATATAASSSPAQSESPSVAETPEFLAGAQGPGVGVRDYLLGEWHCVTTGEYDATFFGMDPNRSGSLPSDLDFNSNGTIGLYDHGRRGNPKPVLSEWQYTDGALIVGKGYDHVQLPEMIQIPSTVEISFQGYDDPTKTESTTSVAFETNSMTMKVAEYIEPTGSKVLDQGATVTCRK